MARKIPSLPRVLGARALFAAAYGEIAGSLYFALGVTAVYALSLTPVVFLAAGVLFALAAAAYAEGGATLPEPGGASALARRAFNDLAGFVAGWATVLDYVLVIALSALFVPHYAVGALGEPEALSGAEAAALAAALVVVVTVVRLVRRPRLYGAGIVVAAVDLMVQAALAALGLVLLFSWDGLTADVDLGVAPTWDSLAFALPIAMLGYTGLEKVAALAGEARDPARTVPTGVRTSVFTVVLLYVAIATAAISAFPSTVDPSAPAGFSNGLSTTWQDAPLLGLAEAIGDRGGTFLGHALRLVVGIAACSILIVSVITGFSGCARLMGALAAHAQLPAAFGRRGRRSLASPLAVAAIGAAACLFLLVGALFEGEEAVTLASLYSFGILIAFMLAQAAVIWLRITEPDLPRPFVMHGNVCVRGRLVPITSVVGAVLSFAAWVIALGTHDGAQVLGPLWMVAGLGIYAAVRVRAKEPLLSRHEPAAPPPEEVTDVAYGCVVVALERDDVVDEETAAIACRIAAESDAALIGVTCITVPVRHALDHDMARREREAAAVQRAAYALADEYGVAYTGVVLRTRNPGRAIVDVAAERCAGLIVIGSPEKRRIGRTKGEEAFGRTVDFVLRKAPCRVIAAHFPAAVLASDGAVPALGDDAGAPVVATPAAGVARA